MVVLDNNVLFYLTLNYLAEKYPDNRDRQKFSMHVANAGLSDTQFETMLENCRQLRLLLGDKELIVGSAVKAEFYVAPPVSYNKLFIMTLYLVPSV